MYVAMTRAKKSCICYMLKADMARIQPFQDLFTEIDEPLC